ncbi:MAG: oligosaccharide flippase family protein [Leptospiraceae bacterium]|nr:oligosaccharide flippase family protein [Leptospiraceae bacterium]
MASLFFLQGVNYLLPFLSMPYLTRVLGPESFGILSFYQSLTQFFMIFADYGFYLLAPREIAIVRDRADLLNRGFSEFFFAKLLLFCFIAFLYSSLVLFVPRFEQNPQVGLLFLFMILGHALFPQWYFQGIEKMHYIALGNFISKFIFILPIFFIVTSPEDLFWVPLLWGGGYISAAIFGLTIAFVQEKARLQKVNAFAIFEKIRAGFPLFLSSLSSISYTSLTPVLLGLWSSHSEVALYTLADRIVAIAKTTLQPLQQALYPYMARKVAFQKERSYVALRALFFFMGLIGLSMSLFLFLLSEEIVLLLGGGQFQKASPILALLSIHPFLVACSGVLGVQILLNLGKNKLFAMILFSASVIHLVVMVFIVPSYAALGAAISVTMAELWVSLVMFFLVTKLGLFSKLAHV